MNNNPTSNNLLNSNNQNNKLDDKKYSFNQSYWNEQLKQLPNPCRSILQGYFSNTPFSFLSATIVQELQEASGLNQAELGLLLLPLATSFAVAPVSDFFVGAIAFDSECNAYFGANFEFAGTHIGQTIHAEQSAIANAWQLGAKELVLLVINYPPCGHCRQFINEVKLADNFLIQLPNSEAQPLTYYLPQDFSPKDLGIEERILGKQTQQSDNNNATSDTDLKEMAKLAHDTSHAPYSGNKNGIALLYEEGENKEIISGRYAENRAFNPSLPALQVALNSRRLQGKDWQAIKQAVMVETKTTLSQYDNASSLLKEICGVALEVVANSKP